MTRLYDILGPALLFLIVAAFALSLAAVARVLLRFDANWRGMIENQRRLAHLAARMREREAISKLARERADVQS